MNKKLMWILIVFGIIGVALGGLFIYEISSYGYSGATNKKPAIYLYPEEDSVINVELVINGKLIKDIPMYGNGWEVFVTTEGLIENQYDYLYYEAWLNEIVLPTEGWIVKYDNLENWFELYLTKLGLNEKEKSQFKEYWLNELPESNYYEIKLLSNQFLEENMNLQISPEPESILRLNFHFRSLNEQVDIEEPKIHNFERKGFTVVEWGGIIQN